MIDEIKKLMKSKKVVIGTEKTMKELKAGNLKRVFLTSNCPHDVKDNIEHYATLAKVEIVQLSVPNDELGVVCKKQFAISIISELKEQ